MLLLIVWLLENMGLFKANVSILIIW